MAYTKLIAKKDKITIDSTDVSNSFNAFAAPGEHSTEDASGFSDTGYDETLAGSTAIRFEGTAIYTKELAAIVGPLFYNRTPCVITYQPDGLGDATREVFSGTCIIMQFGPENVRGSLSTMPFVAVPSTSAGITVNNWT